MSLYRIAASVRYKMSLRTSELQGTNRIASARYSVERSTAAPYGDLASREVRLSMSADMHFSSKDG